MDDDDTPGSLIAGLIERAQKEGERIGRAAEREACAKIARDYASEYKSKNASHITGATGSALNVLQAVEEIARRIEWNAAVRAQRSEERTP